MTNEEYNKFVDLIHELSKNFDGNINTKKIQFYFYKLKKYKYESIKRAINYLINKRVYHSFPIVGEIVTAIKDSKFSNIKI